MKNNKSGQDLLSHNWHVSSIIKSDTSSSYYYITELCVKQSFQLIFTWPQNTDKQLGMTHIGRPVDREYFNSATSNVERNTQRWVSRIGNGVDMNCLEMKYMVHNFKDQLYRNDYLVAEFFLRNHYNLQNPWLQTFAIHAVLLKVQCFSTWVKVQVTGKKLHKSTPPNMYLKYMYKVNNCTWSTEKSTLSIPNRS